VKGRGWRPSELGIGNAELIEGGLRLVEECFRLRSSSYDPTSRMRLEAKELRAQSFHRRLEDEKFRSRAGGAGRLKG